MPTLLESQPALGASRHAPARHEERSCRICSPHACRAEELRAPLQALRAAGERQGFSDEELLTLNVVALWRKG